MSAGAAPAHGDMAGASANALSARIPRGFSDDELLVSEPRALIELRSQIRLAAGPAAAPRRWPMLTPDPS